jgi:hypothetical protein
MNFNIPSFSLQKLSGWIGALAVIIGAVFAFDARYNTTPAIDSLKAEVVSEIAVNRGAMISMMQGEADDIEFEMIQLEANNETIPRYLVDKHKLLNRQIERLQKNENISSGTAN